MALANYITLTRGLIRDTQGLFVPRSQIIEYINEGRTTTALLTGCIRRFIAGQPAFGTQAQAGTMIAGGLIPGVDPNSTFQTIANLERYPYVGFGNYYLAQQYAGLRGISDIVTVAVSRGGAYRPVLDWLPWEDFQSYCRSVQILVSNYPAVFSIFNDGEQGEVWLFPPPQTANEMEWDVFCTPAPIYTNDDPDMLPITFQNGVKYYAAARAFEDSFRYDMAERMYRRFEESNGMRRGAVDRGKVPTRYQEYP